MQLHFRQATAADARCVAHLLTDAFANYNMYRAVLNRFFFSDSQYIDYLNKLHYVQAMSNIRKGYCLLAEHEGTPVAAAVMQHLGKTHISLWDYLRSGAFTLWQYAKPTKHFLPFLDQSSEQAKNNAPEGTWYLESLVVSPEWQSKKVGGRFIDQGIVPFIAQRGATQLRLVTNTAMNVHFYTRHAFRQTDYRKIQEVEVWTLQREIALEE